MTALDEGERRAFAVLHNTTSAAHPSGRLDHGPFAMFAPRRSRDTVLLSGQDGGIPGKRPGDGRATGEGLIEKYRALPEMAQVGQEGDRILVQLKALRSDVAPSTRDAVDLLQAAQIFRQAGQGWPQARGRQRRQTTDGGGCPGAIPGEADAGRGCSPQVEDKVLGDLDVLKLGKDNLQAGLNRLGDDSWELVGVFQGQYVFKRAR